MENQKCNLGLIFFMVLIILIFFAIPILNAATISGTVFKEDGSSPVTNASIAVNVYGGAPCGSHQLIAQGTTGNGNFVITGLSPGIYFLKAVNVSGTADYIDEWWSVEGSIWDCWGAETIVINSSEDVISNKNFQLDLYGRISGSVYDANGNPMAEQQILDVSAFRGSSCENSEWIDVSAWIGQPSYTIEKVPPGTYYVRTHNKGYVWYIDEYHTTSGNTNNGISYLCESATQVTVSSGMDTQDVDFQLDSGGRISGTVYKSDGTTPVTDAEIFVSAYEGTPCDAGRSVAGVSTLNGDYILAGIPPGNYYIQARRSDGANYLSEWYNVPASSNNCTDADAVQVWVGGETKDIDFQLDGGGSITGKIVDESGQPLGNVKIQYNSKEMNSQAMSDQVDGTFTVYGLGPGPGQIRIISDPGRYVVGFRRTYYLENGEKKDIGTLTVQKGAVISGMVTKGGVPLQEYGLYVGAKLILDKVDTSADGTFSFVLPPGNFTITSKDAMDSITTVPYKIVVAEEDIMTNKSIPPIAAYDLSNGDIYNGTVTINTPLSAGSGVFMVMSFMNDEDFDINNWGAMNGLSMGGMFDGSITSNPYQFATPLGSTVRLTMGLYSKGNDENESFTVINSIGNVTSGGTYNYTYNSLGSIVDGYVTRNGEPALFALIGLYRKIDNEFKGFAKADHTGHYVLYDVPDGTYWVGATAEDYDGIIKTPDFIVNDNVTIPTIQIVSVMDDIDGDGVSDDNDNCPNTPIGAEVDANGCADTQKDSDGDGVSDAIDQCSDTPSGVSVDVNGCSSPQLDSDSDGVTDDQDECPGTPSEAECVYINGCSTTQQASIIVQKEQVINNLNATISSMFTQEQLDAVILNERKKWDINGDGKITIEEAIYALKIASGVQPE
ncbi:thrombospondin type 3 repeat-containing protein [Desulfobacula sp.]|uniref:carboxypeptidase-like regulatory domain-containing protein n=1 Tax=Desulfobacula sp. TaxID=2593537 RepID=UPI00262C77B6|nr:thrombospondin type 3 repeat-containing protein [Desulfobacula sp.]